MERPADRHLTPHAGDAAEGHASPGRQRVETAASRSAFVVQVTTESASGDFRGRVQHLATLDGGNFSSADAMVAIIRRVLERIQRTETDRDDPPRS